MSWKCLCKFKIEMQMFDLGSKPNAEADCSTRGTSRSHGGLTVVGCSALRNINGLTQYTGSFLHQINEKISGEGIMQEAIQDSLESAETGSSKFKATVRHLALSGRPPGLAGVHQIAVKDAQHVGLLLSALFKAQARGLTVLKICCREDGDCGCDKNAPHFGPSPGFTEQALSFFIRLFDFDYHCPKVRDLASLEPQLGDQVTRLSFRGCRSVEVWPDFATMTSLTHLDLSFTSLKEWPTGVQLLPRLGELDIRGCLQLPAEEMIKAITCNALGCSNSVCCRDSLASLLADLRDHRRDRCSVVDALDSHWPGLVALCREQWPYLQHPTSYPPRTSTSFRGAELCILINLMYDLWFGEEEGRSHDSSEGPSPIMKKMRRLLCSEIFMSLPFYVWKIGRTRPYALDGWEDYSRGEGYESYMALALIGSASIGCFNASLTEDLKDRIVNFLQSFVEAPKLLVHKNAIPMHYYPSSYTDAYGELELSEDAHQRLAMRVGNAVCKMATAPGVAAELGEGFMHTTIDGLGAGVLHKIMPKVMPQSVLIHMDDSWKLRTGKRKSMDDAWKLRTGKRKKYG